MLKIEEIKRLQSLSDDALLAELGRAVLKHNQRGLQARPPSLKKIKEEAHLWLLAENDRIKQAVCGSKKIREISTSEPGATEKLLRVVADVIGGLAAYVPAGTVAEIMVRDGIPKYCRTIWTEEL